MRARTKALELARGGDVYSFLNIKVTVSYFSLVAVLKSMRPQP